MKIGDTGYARTPTGEHKLVVILDANPQAILVNLIGCLSHITGWWIYRHQLIPLEYFSQRMVFQYDENNDGWWKIKPEYKIKHWTQVKLLFEFVTNDIHLYGWYTQEPFQVARELINIGEWDDPHAQGDD